METVGHSAPEMTMNVPGGRLMIPVGASVCVSRPMFRRSVRRWLRRDAEKPKSLAGSTWASVGALGGIRTPNLLIRSQMLYPLSYERWASESLACTPGPTKSAA
jgi:hypothetical protein